MDWKPKILEVLEKLRQKEVANKEPFKVRAYANVIKNLKADENPITNIDDIKDIKGIGKKIHEKIKELLDTGDLKQLEKYDDRVKTINELMTVHGIGPAKANELFDKHNISSIKDLKAHPELLNEKQKLGLHYVDDFTKRIPRAEMEKHDNYLKDVLTKIDSKLKYEIVGSYRRGAKDSGDIDVIITHEDDPKDYDDIIKNIVASLKKEDYLKDDFALGPHKYLGVCRLKRHKTFRRIDFLYATAHVWPFSLLYFTGSLQFNIEVRKVALERGLSLSEYGFSKDDKLLTLPLLTEEAVLKHVGLKYVPPMERTGDLSKYKI
jgi:DNA polymerase/3'-5' exonuclease PolX